MVLSCVRGGGGVCDPSSSPFSVGKDKGKMGVEKLLRGDCGDLGGVLEYIVWDVGIQVGGFF